MITVAQAARGLAPALERARREEHAEAHRRDPEPAGRLQPLRAGAAAPRLLRILILLLAASLTYCIFTYSLCSISRSFSRFSRRPTTRCSARCSRSRPSCCWSLEQRANAERRRMPKQSRMQTRRCRDERQSRSRGECRAEDETRTEQRTRREQSRRGRSNC